MLRASPGKEKEFRYFQQWLEASAAIDRIIEETEPESEFVDGGRDHVRTIGMPEVIHFKYRIVK